MAAIKGAGNALCTYNANALTNYLNSIDLANTIEELEATHLGSTGMESDAGLPGHNLSIGGDWNATLDGFLGPDSLTGTKRTAVISFEDGATVVSYTWTSQAFITGYNVKATATGKLEWTATLRLSGIGARSVV